MGLDDEPGSIIMTSLTVALVRATLARRSGVDMNRWTYFGWLLSDFLMFKDSILGDPRSGDSVCDDVIS
jgi:hypothetical protein